MRQILWSSIHPCKCCLSQISCQILIYSVRIPMLADFGPLFPRVYGRHWFSLFQVLVENLRKWCHLLKNTTRIEVLITLCVEICTNIRVKVFVILYANCRTYCYDNFNPNPGLRTRKLDGGRNFWEVKVYKNAISNVRNGKKQDKINR